MRKYIAFYNRRKAEVEAPSSYEAQKAAGALFKVPPKRQYQIAVVLADVPFSPNSLPGS